jgi:S-methylmethionine-dependent homocysteine/selenocysteine methylase
MKRLLEENELILAEAAIVEPLRRSGRAELHPRLVHAPLVYDPRGRKELGGIYQSYIDVAQERRLPFLICTPTWRANRERLEESGYPTGINGDAVAFLERIRERQGADGGEIRIGGTIGCRNDCYRPEEGLETDEAERFHQWQVDQLAQAGVDFLIAETLPNVAEATGISRAMARTEKPYVISFVIGRDGHILDGTRIHDAVLSIDNAVASRPLGYMVNCAYPGFFNPDRQPTELYERMIGYLGNASSLDHCDLDGAEHLQADDVADWGERMLRLNRRYGIKILGGCCGTGVAHLRYVIEHG